jgi:hypothetical protein
MNTLIALSKINIDLDKIIWARTMDDLWSKEDDIDLIKIFRHFTGKKKFIYLSNRFPNKSNDQCQRRYNNYYSSYIMKKSLSQVDKEYIIDSVEQEKGYIFIAKDLGISREKVREYCRNNNIKGKPRQKRKLKVMSKSIKKSDNMFKPKVTKKNIIKSEIIKKQKEQLMSFSIPLKSSSIELEIELDIDLNIKIEPENFSHNLSVSVKVESDMELILTPDIESDSEF